MDKIGIKLANSEFYPILEAGNPARKRLVVTTVNDDQRSVQIDLYRGEGPMVGDAAYVGSLVVEDIPDGKAGEPDVRLELELDEADMLRCTAVEEETGATQSIRVSLESLGEENSYEVPDFNFEEEEEEITDHLPEEATSPEEGAGLLAAADELRERKARPNILPWIAGIIVLAIVGFALWFFLFSGPRSSEGPAQAPVATAGQPARSAPAAAPATAPAAASATAPASTAVTPAPNPAAQPTAPAQAKVTPAPAKASPPPAAVAGKRYRIKWGDTLWDLAWVYYRDPWLYPRIAKANRIANPDHIVAGTWIVIPAR